jgi:hypothetical protein
MKTRPLYPRERTRDTHWKGYGWAQSRSGGRVEKKILPQLGLEVRPLGHPARSQSLSRLPRVTSSDKNCQDQ